MTDIQGEKSWLPRPGRVDVVLSSLEHNRVVALLGPRQCGKTTLARMIARERECAFFDLEHPVDARRLEAPMISLARRTGLVIIDEIQRRPELFEILRVLVDRQANAATFLVLGSAAPRLVKGASESLAGRIGFVDLSGFDLMEVGSDSFRTLWHRGGLPRSYLAPDDEISYRWRDDFIRTFLERDIPQLGLKMGAETLRRFWTMLAHYHGQVWNAAELARSLGSSESTARRYLDIMSGAYMVRQLQPWHANLKKRQVKSPKIYIRDSGVLHGLLSLESEEDLLSHPKVGASWEGFVVEEIIKLSQSRDVYFWSTYAGAELDLLLFSRGRAIGFEVKLTDAPKATKSMRVALDDLGLEHLYVVYPGEVSYPMDDRLSALSVLELPAHVRSIVRSA